MKPNLALGQIVHQVIESLSVLPVEERLKKPLVDQFNLAWRKVEGIKGGFKDKDQEEKYKQQGIMMIKRIQENPGPITNLAIKIKKDLPHYYLSKEDDIILCGKIDWLEYLPDDDSVHIIDFKTGKSEEDKNSLQLPIYYLLTKNCQQRNVSKASYWYLRRDKEPVEIDLPKDKEAKLRVLSIARQIKHARKQRTYTCPRNGCFACKPLEAVANGKAKFVGVDDYNRDIYVLV